MEAFGPERGADKPTYSLIFPTYNPGLAIDRTIREIESFLQRERDWEVVFVCDGCTDDTVHRLHDVAQNSANRIRIIAHAPNRGKGYAVRCGLAAAAGRFLVFTDVDLAYGFDEIQRVAAALRDGANVAVASRLHPHSRVVLAPALLGYAYRRHLQSIAFSLWVRLVLPIRQRDTQAGLKGLTEKAAAALLPRLHCDGFTFDCELLALASTLKLDVTEVPVTVRYETGKSTTNLAAIGKMLRSLWAIRRACRSWRQECFEITSAEREHRHAA